MQDLGDLQPVRGRDPEGTRQRVLSAARAVFAEHGFEGARVDEVARRARVSKGTVYNVVSSKEELFLRCLADGMEDAQRRIEAAVRTERAPGPALHTLVRTLFLELLPSLTGEQSLHHQAVGVMGTNSGVRDPLLRQLRGFYRDRERDISELVDLGQSAGAFRADLAPEDFAILLQATIDGLVYRSTLDPSRVIPPRLVAVFAALLRGGLERQGDGER
jgi:AcrR family transcriptional regulator